MNPLLAARKASGLTQQELADKAHCSRVHISGIERGRFNPSVPMAKQLGKVLGVRWTVFYGDEESGKD